MESPTPMAHEELLELAALDALGLLDQYESALFTRSFHHASATVQKQIIEFQADLAADTSLLPDEDPGPELRERVLAAVAKAVETEEADFAPLASIGTRADRMYEPPMVTTRPSRMSSIFWRAAVLVLSVSLVIVSYFGVQAFRFNNTLARAAFSNTVQDEIGDVLGPSYQEFVNHPACRTVRFTAPDNEFEGSLTLYLNNSTNEAFIVALSMPAKDKPYSIYIDTGSGRQTKLRSFDVQGPIIGVHLANLSPTTMASTTSWSIRDSKGTTVLRGS